MPTYDYECDACGHKFEQYQGINDAKLTKCPACKKQKLRRLIGTGAAIMFKGSGFYQTDYRSDSYRKAAAADKPAESSSSESKSSDSKSSEPKSTETKADSKPSSSDSSNTSRKKKKS